MPIQMNIERQPVIQRGNLTIDPQCCTVTLAGEEIDLYPKEFDVLCLLTQYSGWVLSSEQIYEAVWHEKANGYFHAVENTIFQIRKKIKKYSSDKNYIKTVVGYGYKFEV